MYLTWRYMFAIQSNSKHTQRYLSKRPSRINMFCRSETLLIFAVCLGRNDIIDIYLKGVNSRTALHDSCFGTIDRHILQTLLLVLR